jgi:hypothetical protein
LIAEFTNQGVADQKITPIIEKAIQMLAKSRALMDLEIKERLTAPVDAQSKYWAKVEAEYSEQRAERQVLREQIKEAAKIRRAENIKKFELEAVIKMDKHAEVFAKDFFVELENLTDAEKQELANAR